MQVNFTLSLLALTLLVDFDENKDAFRATAQRVQNLFAQYTPSVPINPPLDTRFHNYLMATFPNYENRAR